MAGVWRSIGLLTTTVVSLGAQRTSLPPVRQLGARLAVGTDTLGSVSGIRVLSDGRVLVNDLAMGKLVLYDAMLSHPVVVADSSRATNHAYGASSGGLIRYLGDTTLFADGASLSLLMIDPRGRIVRVVSPPRPQDIGSLTLPIGGAAIDGMGRLTYRSTGANLAPSVRGAYGTSSSSRDTVSTRDSSYILRADLRTRLVDTVGFITLPRFEGTAKMIGMGPDGFPQYRTVIDPILYYDGWTILSDGSIAIVRGQSYRVDWINPDGTPGPSTPLAHEWHRLSDSEKVAIVDSVRHVTDSVVALRARADSIAVAGGRKSRNQGTWTTVVSDPADLPDYRAPFTGTALADPVTTLSAVIGDADDRVWIRQGPNVHSSFTAPPPVYDVVDRRGQIVDRVQLPPSLTLVGFGPGVVYLTSREGTGVVLVKYRISLND